MRKTAIVPLIVLAVVVVSARPQSKHDSTTNPKASSQQPIAEYGSSVQPGDTASRNIRDKRNQQHRATGRPPISELPEGVEELPLINHWWRSVPAIPATQSTLIVVASVVDSQAFLSTDNTSVYSEFTLLVEKVLKNCGPNPELSKGEHLTTERNGGAVRFPSGRVQNYRVANQGLPKDKRRYLFFLKANEEGEDFIIVTAYQLANGRVQPLDGDSQLQFSKYSRMAETDFLSKVRSAARNPCEGPQAGRTR